MKKKYIICPVIYKTTNLVNGLIYVGQHKTSSDDGYLGSGKLLKQDLLKYNTENFKREILEFCNFTNINKREIYWIDALSARNQNIGYNLTIGGGGVNGLVGENHPNFGLKRSEKIKQKLSRIHKNIPFNYEAIQRMSEINRGKHRSPEIKNKIRKKLTGIKHNKKRKDNNSIGHCLYIFNIIDPHGNIYNEIRRFKKFCEDKNLNYDWIIRKKYKNNKTKYKGWIIEKIIYNKDHKV